MIRLYEKYWSAGSYWSHRPLKKLTGRWKLVTINREIDLYIEVKGWFFREWIHENYIEMREEHEEIFECSHT